MSLLGPSNNWIARGGTQKSYIFAWAMSPMPWLLPIASVRNETIIIRPSVMLRSNRSSG